MLPRVRDCATFSLLSIIFRCVSAIDSALSRKSYSLLSACMISYRSILFPVSLSFINSRSHTIDIPSMVVFLLFTPSLHTCLLTLPVTAFRRVIFFPFPVPPVFMLLTIS